MTEGPTQDDAENPPPPRGSMRFQDESTTPREPSLAEQRARRQAIAQQEREEQEARVAAKKAGTKRKLLIGSGVTVGLVGLVAIFYGVAKPENVTAVCTDAGGTIVQDDDCDESYVTSHHGYYDHTTGFLFLPILGRPGFYDQYRYNYGGTGVIGSRVSGGSYDPPSHANVSTKSGRSVQRGGFGISGKSGGGSGSGKGGSGGKSGGS